MPKEQHINPNNIVIVPTVGCKKDEPPAKKPKLDNTPEKEKDATEKCDTESTVEQVATPKDTKEDCKKSGVSCVKNETKVSSWASGYLQSIGQQGKPRMSLSLTKNNMPVGQPSVPITQANVANTSNWAPINLPTRYIYPNPLSSHFQMQTSINTTQNTLCSATSLNFTGPLMNYASPTNYNSPINYTVPVNYTVPISNVSSNYSAPQSYSAAINYTASLNYTVPLNYPTTNDTPPINYNAPLNFNAPLTYNTPIDNTALTNYTTPQNYTTPINEPATQERPPTPLIDEPNSPISERTESVTPLQYEPISPLTEPTTPTKLDNSENIDKELANCFAKCQRLANDSTKSKKRQLPEMVKTTSETKITTKPKIKLNLIKKKTDKYSENNLDNVHEQRDKCKAHGKIKRDKDENKQHEKHTKRFDSASSSKEKVVNTHESRSLKSVPKRKFTESYKSVKETSKAEYSKKERQKKLSLEHHQYHETEFHKKKDTKEEKHKKYDYHKTKIIDKIKEIRSLYDKAKGTSNKKVNDSNKPSTSKIRRSRTPELVQRKRLRTNSVNAEKDKSTKKTTPVKSIVQPINKIKYPTNSIGPNSHSTERNAACVQDHFDLRSKLSRTNKYFQKNRRSNENFTDRDNLVVTINQPEVNTEPKTKSPPKVTVTEKTIKSKNKKYKTIKFTIKVMCKDGEGSSSSSSEDSEEEKNAERSQNDLSFLDDFNVDEIVDSLKNSQKRSLHGKNIVSKNNKLIDKEEDKLCAVSETKNGDKAQVIVNESIDCITLDDTINTENNKNEQNYDSTINESNDCVILDTAEIDKVKTEVDENNESNDCFMLTNIKTEQDVINETDESCVILDNTIDIISIKSASTDSVIDIKPDIQIKSETLEKSNDCIVVEFKNHSIKIEDSISYIKSEQCGIDNTEQHVKKELDNIADENENETNINGSVTKINENLNFLYDEDTMEIPQLAQEPMRVDEIENMQGIYDNIASENCSAVCATSTFELNEQQQCESEFPIVSDTITPNVEKTVSKIDNNEAIETEYNKQDLSESNSDTINIKFVEIPNIIKKEPCIISPVTTNNIEIGDTVHNQDTNQHNMQNTESNAEVIKLLEIPVFKEKSLIVSPIKKEPLVEIIPSQNIEINNNKGSLETKTASEENKSAKSDSPKNADTEKVVSKNLEPVTLTKENKNSAHDDKTKNYVCKPDVLTVEKAIEQEIINNIEPELAHLKPKDSQAIINAVAVKAKEIINTTKPETSVVKSKDTNKVSSPIATKSVETENRQVAIVKKKESEELGDIKEQLESRMFEYLHERYTVTALIHEGRFSKIFKCNDSKDRNCVVKLLKSPNDRVSLGLEKENILKKIQRGIPKENLNIVMVINGFGFERRWAFLMDYYPYNLTTVLNESKKGFSIDKLPDLARQLIMAVLVLRNNQIVHSDIKPSHILVDESRQRLKLCGFDSCYHATTIEVIPNIGTKYYRAPEIIIGFSASFSIDVWAAGTVLYEMFTKRKLFPGRFNNQILFNQLCLFGDLPADMIQRSSFATNHFEGLSFVRKYAIGSMEKQIIHKFYKTHKLYNLLLSSYNFFWGLTKKTRRDDLVKLYHFYELLEKMLVLDPRYRLPIEFVCADPFINEFQ